MRSNPQSIDPKSGSKTLCALLGNRQGLRGKRDLSDLLDLPLLSFFFFFLPAFIKNLQKQPKQKIPART